MTQRSLLAATALATFAWPGAAAAKEFQAQNNEVEFAVDATFARRGQNNSDVTLTYTWLPGALDQNDEVVPALRHFVRQPGFIWVGLRRSGDFYDSVTGLHGGATGWLPGDRFYGSAELGIEYDSVENELGDRIENAFISGNARVEAGVRVLPLLQLGGYYRFRPVLVPLPETTLTGVSSERSGATQEVGGSLGLATPDDRLLVTALVGYRLTDWTFSDKDEGDITGRGLYTALHASYQLSSTTSLTLRGEVSSIDWVNGRMNQEDINELGGEATVLSVRGDLGFLYWFEGHWGFRVSLGGGYIGEGPLQGSFDSGLFRLGVGFTTRY